MVLFYILASTFLVSLLSFVGVLTLFLKEKILDRALLLLVAFSAGALLGGAFFHLIPEAVLEIGFDEYLVLRLFSYLVLGFCTFFLLEQFIQWHHHHVLRHTDIEVFSYLILLSDGIHNFIDGLVIAASFVVSLPLGFATVLAVSLHEIPQELGDFGVLVYGGFKKFKALFVNFLSALLAIIGGLIGFLISEKVGDSIVFLLPFAAGNFIYIACSDLIPEIKKTTNAKESLVHFFIFLLGVILMLLLRMF